MNLRSLKVFVTTQIDNQLAECGIDVDQIEQIKIRDRQIPSNDNDDNVVWMLDTFNSSDRDSPMDRRRDYYLLFER